MDFLAFVPDANVGRIQIFAESGGLFLYGKMIGGNCTQQKSADFVLPTKLEKLLRVRQGANRRLHLTKASVKPFLQLRHGNVRGVLVIENRERKAEFRPELFQ